MCFRLLLTFLLFIVTSFYSLAQDSTPSTPVLRDVPIVVDPGPVLPPELRITDGGRNWTPVELQPFNIPSSYNQWSHCYRSTAQECRQECEPTPDGRQVSLIRIAMTECLPAPSDRAVVFSESLLPAQKQDRDNRICQCYERGQASPLESFSFSQGVRTRSSRGSQWRREREISEATTDVRIRNRLITDRFSAGFSAATFLNNTADQLQLAAKYSARRDPSETCGEQPRSGQGGNRGGQPSSGRTSSAEREAEQEQLSQELFNGTRLPPGYCLPYRNYLASKQFPVNSQFYSDLNAEGSFDPREWDFTELLDQLTARKTAVGDLHTAFTSDTEGKKLRARMRFLHFNPAFKNIFLSSDQRMKSDLFDLIKSMPRPNCGRETCTRDAAWTRAMKEYRFNMARFLARPDVIRVSRCGSRVSRTLSVMLAENEAHMNAASSENHIPAEHRFDPAAWSTFCDGRREDQQAQNSGSLEVLQGALADFGNYDFKDYTQDHDYQKVNADLCGATRSGPNGSKNFQDYFRDVCRNPSQPKCQMDNRAALLANFLDEYPSGPPSAVVDSLKYFLDGELNTAPAGNDDIRNYNRVAADYKLAKEPMTFVGEEYQSFNTNGMNSLSKSSLATMKADARTSTSQSATTSQSNPFNFTQPQAPQADAPYILPPAPVTRASDQQVADTRSQISQGQSRLQGIQDELSSLRTSLSRESSSPNPDASAISAFNQKITDWEKKLRDQTQSNQRLQDQLAEMERSRRATPPQPEADPSTVTRRPASVPEAAPAMAAAVPQGGVSGGSMAAPQMMGGTTSGSGSIAPVSRGNTPTSVIRPMTTTESLGEFGVQAVTVRNGITVAEASGSIDYERLRAESANSVLPLTVTPAEFGQFSQNVEAAIARYVDRVKQIPGQVVRVELQNGSETMEIFVVKNGDQISIVQSQTALPERAPASVAPVVRENTLEGLRGELVR